VFVSEYEPVRVHRTPPTDTLKDDDGSKWLVAADVNAKSHLRGLNGMMAAVAD
jgi:hypothetical protein